MNSAMKGKQPPPNPLMLGMTKGDFMLRALESVKPAELEQTILILPFTTALSLVPFLVEWLQERKQACSFFPRLAQRLACLASLSCMHAATAALPRSLSHYHAPAHPRTPFVTVFVSDAGVELSK